MLTVYNAGFNVDSICFLAVALVIGGVVACAHRIINMLFNRDASNTNIFDHFFSVTNASSHLMATCTSIHSLSLSLSYIGYV
jgi:hypothetical protein